MSTATTTITSGDTFYHQALRKIADKSKHPLPQLTMENGKKVTVALRHGGNAGEFCTLIRAQHGCRTCVSRAKLFGRLSIFDTKGRMIPLFMIAPKALGNDKTFADIAEANLCLCTSPIVGLMVLTGSHVGGFVEEEGVEPETKRAYRHYHIGIPEDKRTEVDTKEAALLEKAFHRYCPSFLPNLFETLLPRGGGGSWEEKVESIKKSLGIVKDLLPRATYGYRVAPSVEWLLRVVEFFENQGRLPFQRTKGQMWLTSAQMLLWTAIHPDGLDGHNAVSPVIQQAHNFILPLMDKALDATAMVSMLNTRLSPLNYQRPTAAPTMGQVQNAISALGDFSNKILTHEEAALLPHAIVLPPGTAPPFSAMDAFQAMLSSPHVTVRKKNPATFAERCAPMDTVVELLRKLRENPGKKLEIQCGGLNNVYVASTTLDPKKLCVPHLWCFMGSRPSGEEWAQVALVHPLFEYIPQYKSVLFTLEKSTTAQSFPNCCFPEFLDVSLRRACRSAMEDLNHRIKLTVEPGIKASVGVGISAKTETGVLITPIRVRWEGREYQISKLC